MVELIYEVGINANGDVNLAKKMIDVAHSAGCQYVKFQKRTVSSVYSKEELDKPRESPWGTTTREQKYGIEFTHADYVEIDAYCKGKIKWFASPWDEISIPFLTGFDVPFIKIPSALITNKNILEGCWFTNTPVILSTGMSDLAMIDRAVDILGKSRIYCIMQCTSTYPTKTEDMNLNCIKTLKERYPWTKIGFSNHHPGIIYMPIAVALGAEVIEFHGTLDRSMYGSDQAASIEPEGVFKLAKYCHNVPTAMGDGVKRMLDSEKPIAEKLRR